MDSSEDSKVPTTPLRDEDLERVEPGELLDENWFFGNSLLDRKKRISRCFSDPCPSSKLTQDMFVGKSYEETYSSINKLTHQGGPSGSGGCGCRRRFGWPRLIKAPSMPPPCMSREASPDNHYQAKESDALKGGSESSSLFQPSRVNSDFRRAPSLPLCVDGDEDDESEYSMGRLIRQASLGRSDVLPPQRVTTSYKITVPSTVPRHRRRRKHDSESSKPEGFDERRHLKVLDRTRSMKSLADLESEEVKGSKDVFSFDKKELNSNVAKILPCSQEKKIRGEADEHKAVRRPYLSEAWLAQMSSSTPLLNNAANKSAEDMKAQIKFWARAVASNVRQECW